MTGDGKSTLTFSEDILAENNNINGQRVMERVGQVAEQCSSLGEKYVDTEVKADAIVVTDIC